ncbi:MAG: hypothetical protein M3Z28_10230 [Candidatus Dormibacteraeota bacterium]|nr:hypothetical protein [Candidatus Dormibacteraeota bacterium]
MIVAGKEREWTIVYQTPSPSDADLVRTTLEVAGYPVWVQGGNAPSVFTPGIDTSSALTVSVPSEDAEDARDYLQQKTSLLPNDDAPAPSDDQTSPPLETLEDTAQEILELRRQHEVAACKYCGIPTLDVAELDLESRMIALLRAAGLGVNTATFSEFGPGERICTDCAGHEVACDLCGRVVDAFLDQGEYRQANDDEAYICSDCRSRLEDRLQADRDW